MYTFTSILFYIFICLTEARIKWRLCEYATPIKYIGRYEYPSGIPTTLPFYSLNISSQKSCNENCKLNNSCFATVFETTNSHCSFYNTTSYDFMSSNDKKYSRWIPCNTSRGDQPYNDRCLGLWITYEGRSISIDSYINLDESNIDKVECREQCLKNSLCGFINRNDNNCQLVPKWPYENRRKSITKFWKMEKWICVDNFISHFNIQMEVQQTNKEKCTGFWRISSRNSSLKSSVTFGLNFHTQSYTECLSECIRYSDCYRAYFNFTYSLCILDDIERSYNTLPFIKPVFILFEWICKYNDSQIPPLNEDEVRYLNLGMKCYTIVNNINLYIATDMCGNCPSSSNFVKCNEEDKPRKWNIKNSCLNKQAYWAFPIEIRLMNITGHKYMNVTKIFTGLQLYWLAFLSNNNLLRVDYLHCRSFNATRPLIDLQPTEIITKHEWQSQPPKGFLKIYLSKPTKFSISASGTPHHSCKTKPAGIDLMRSMQVLFFNGHGTNQKYLDNPFNFMIDEQGHIYEGLGWKYRCNAVGSFNFETVCIAYIGYFKDYLPGEPFLNSAKKLIKFAVDNRYITENYKLYIQQDLGNSKVYPNLEISIKNWYRYRGFIPEDCKNIKLITLGFNFLCFFCINVLLFYISFKMFSFKRNCKRCNFLSKTTDIQWHKVFPVSSNVSDDEELNFSSNNNKSYVIIYERSNPIVEKNHLKIVKFLKLWIFNNYLETINSRFNGANLFNFLKGFSVQSNDAIIYEIDSFQIDSNESSSLKILICVSNFNSGNFLKSLIRNYSCFCNYFNLEYLEQSNMSIDINVL